MAGRRRQPPEPRRGVPREKKVRARLTEPELRTEVITVVLLGAFNPSIFQPAWLAQQGFIDNEEARAAEIGIIHADAVSFKIGSIGIEVTRERFQAQTDDATSVEALRDLVIGSFGRLGHTPVAALGLNRSTHHEMPSEAAWNDIGHRLLPKGPWEGILEHPGTRNVTVEGGRPDARPGFIRAIFEPSNVIQFGVFQMINDHYQLNGGDPAKNVPASEAMATLADVWDESLERSRSIATHVLAAG